MMNISRKCTILTLSILLLGCTTTKTPSPSPSTRPIMTPEPTETTEPVYIDPTIYIHEDMLIKEMFDIEDTLFGSADFAHPDSFINDMPLSYLEDEAFYIDRCGMFSDCEDTGYLSETDISTRNHINMWHKTLPASMYIQNYDRSWLEDTITTKNRDLILWHNDTVNIDGTIIYPEVILNGIQDDTIIFDARAHAVLDDETKINDDIHSGVEFSFDDKYYQQISCGIRYGDSDLKKVLQGNIVYYVSDKEVGNSHFEYDYGRVYRVGYSPTETMSIRLFSWNDGTIIFFELSPRIEQEEVVLPHGSIADNITDERPRPTKEKAGPYYRIRLYSDIDIYDVMNE